MVPADSAANALPLELTHRDAARAGLEACLAQSQYLTGSAGFTWRLASDEVRGSEQLSHILGFEHAAPLTFALILTHVHPDDLPTLRAQIEFARSEGGDIAQEFRHLMPDQKTVRYLRMGARRLRDPRIQCDYVGAVQDVTELRDAEAALREARAQLAYLARVMSLGALSASIAHEIKQPLAGIITNASTCLRMLATEPPDLAGARETAKRTLRDGNRASDVITRLRALFTRKSVGGEQVDLNQIAQEAVHLAQSDLNRRRVTVLMGLAEDIPRVRGDRIQLYQVVLNLVLNAADAMGGVDDRPRRLSIRTQPEGPDRVRLSVQDTGTGIGAHAARLFEPFYTTKTDGMGIGLSISQTIVESHGGRLWAAQNEGPGATFCFSLPSAPECDPERRSPKRMARVSRDDRGTLGLGL